VVQHLNTGDIIATIIMTVAGSELWSYFLPSVDQSTPYKPVGHSVSDTLQFATPLPNLW